MSSPLRVYNSPLFVVAGFRSPSVFTTSRLRVATEVWTVINFEYMGLSARIALFSLYGDVPPVAFPPSLTQSIDVLRTSVRRRVNQATGWATPEVKNVSEPRAGVQETPGVFTRSGIVNSTWGTTSKRSASQSNPRQENIRSSSRHVSSRTGSCHGRGSARGGERFMGSGQKEGENISRLCTAEAINWTAKEAETRYNNRARDRGGTGESA